MRTACNLYLRFCLRLFKGCPVSSALIPVEVVEVNRPPLEHLVDCLLMLEQLLEAPDHWLCRTVLTSLHLFQVVRPEVLLVELVVEFCTQCFQSRNLPTRLVLQVDSL